MLTDHHPTTDALVVLASVPVKWQDGTPIEFLLDRASAEYVIQHLSEHGFRIVRMQPDD